MDFLIAFRTWIVPFGHRGGSSTLPKPETYAKRFFSHIQFHICLEKTTSLETTALGRIHLGKIVWGVCWKHIFGHDSSIIPKTYRKPT